MRPNVNAVAMVPTELHGQIASTGFCVLLANRGELDPKYLFYWVQTPQFVNGLVSQMRGANYPAVSDGVVKSSRVPYLSLPEQRRIVEILDQADALPKLRNEADALAERILPALFYEMFGDQVSQNVETVFQTILHLAYSGELTTRWREQQQAIDTSLSI